MFETVLIANRGAIAVRIIRTLKSMGVRSVAVYTSADVSSLHVTLADAAVCLGDEPNSYLDISKVLKVAVEHNCQAIHPGYGFLSENANFALECKRQGVVFIGPTPEHLTQFGLKHTAKALAEQSNVPVLPGSTLLPGLDDALDCAESVGYPVMLKSTAGGGGMGISICHTPADVKEKFASLSTFSESNFKNAGMFVEKYVARARHIEVQIFGDSAGKVVVLGERDCSLQRRNQKVVEETPAWGLSPEQRAEVWGHAKRLGASVGYRSAGTVEFLLDVATGRFYFLEVNTRLQVEHGVTEQVSGVDLVQWMVEEAGGELDLTNFSAKLEGASIQVRLYAEDASKSCLPSAGIITSARFPTPSPSVRVDTFIGDGVHVPPSFDPLLAKIIVTAPSRLEAIQLMRQALAPPPPTPAGTEAGDGTAVYGLTHNQEYLRQILDAPEFEGQAVYTTYLDSFVFNPNTIEVVEGGACTSLQDFPGRVGHWAVGVPPSGPMDDYAHRIANALVGNPSDAAALEVALSGPTLKFNVGATISLCGARFQASLDDHPVPLWTSVFVRPGSVLRVSDLSGEGEGLGSGSGSEGQGGCRATLAVRGGFDAPTYLGSRSTFALGKFGGHCGRVLRRGDVLSIDSGRLAGLKAQGRMPVLECPAPLIPTYNTQWRLGVLLGPHAAPDFFTPDSIEVLFGSEYEVHYNSNRLGIRLVGPKPCFARPDGGEAGLHPSNIHDCEYAIGAVNFTGDTPIILTKDGPSLGGFVCPITIIKAELWKVGQLKPGDTIRFVRTSYAAAVALDRATDRAMDALAVMGGPTDLSTDTQYAASAVYQLASDLAKGIVEDKGQDQVRGPALSSPSSPSSSSSSSSPSSSPPSTPPVDSSKTPPLLEFDEEPEGELVQGVVRRIPANETAGTPQVLYRLQGDRNVLIEYGPLVLDLTVRFRVHALMEAFQRNPLPGVVEMAPGVRSVQVSYDSQRVGLSTLLDTLVRVEGSLPPSGEITVPSRVLRLPLAFDASTTKEALEKYRQSVRDEAPWLPSNVEFIRRINGLEGVGDVSDIIYSARYMVLGLGDVYLGAPCAVPLDPRHRLVTTKFNPARTWTAEGEVGIGGVYMCIYGMESPGGYQLVGRTVPVWNMYASSTSPSAPTSSSDPSPASTSTPQSSPFCPCPLLRFFDQVQFYPVSEPELDEYRAAYKQGRVELDISEEPFHLGTYTAFLEENKRSIEEFKARQDVAYQAEAARWAADDEEEKGGGGDDASQAVVPSTNGVSPLPLSPSAPTSEVCVKSPMHGRVWSLTVEVGDVVRTGQKVGVVEGMKMELSLYAPKPGTVVSIPVEVGTLVSPESVLVVLDPSETSEEGGGGENGVDADGVPSMDLDMGVEALRTAYRSGKLTVSAMVNVVLARIREVQNPSVWISRVPDTVLRARAAEFDKALAEYHRRDKSKNGSLNGGGSDSNRLKPLFGIPFAVKDNIDVEGLATTAGCPGYEYTPKVSAEVVQRLEEQGAIVIGKTNLDQFATGLVGVRSPYGVPRNPFDPNFVPGGSSSGSAVAVSQGLVSFSLGTDTAGSGRVPAGFNNIVGWKPTPGLLSTEGVVPACKTLDVVSFFATSCADLAVVSDAVIPATADMISIQSATAAADAPGNNKDEEGGESTGAGFSRSFRFGVLRGEDAEFFGDTEYASIYASTVRRLTQLGGIATPFDYGPFRDAALLLYGGPWVAERTAAVGDFIQANPEVEVGAAGVCGGDGKVVGGKPETPDAGVNDVVRGIIMGGYKQTAVGAFKGQYKLAELRALAEAELQGLDFIVLPTSPTAFTLDDLDRAPVECNSKLGWYTNFVNLFGMSGVALPAGFRSSDGIPAGATLIGRGMADRQLLEFGHFWQTAVGLSLLGATPNKLPRSIEFASQAKVQQRVNLAVVGAHMTGMPLNHQLASLGGRFECSGRTAPLYRFYALPGGLKPGVVRVAPGGRDASKAGSVALEVWSLPTENVGAFLIQVPSPLCIGSLVLSTGKTVLGFLCEHGAVREPGTVEITHLGDWRVYKRESAAGVVVAGSKVEQDTRGDTGGGVVGGATKMRQKQFGSYNDLETACVSEDSFSG